MEIQLVVILRYSCTENNDVPEYGDPVGRYFKIQLYRK